MSIHTQQKRKFSAPWFVWLFGALIAAAVLAFAWWTISPLFINTRVDEAFPASSAPPAAMPTEIQPAAVDPMPTTGTNGTDDMDNQAAAMDTMPSESAMNDQPATVMDDPAAADTMDEAGPPSEPVALSSGSFTQIDALHGAEGSATIYRLPDGQLVLRLESFNAQNGPDLYVGLSGHQMPRSSAEVHEGYLELARLKANQGNQNYELPANLDLDTFKSVVIYCKAFSVVFSTAELIMEPANT